MVTEQIDKLFLELSQFTSAKTATELRLLEHIDNQNMYISYLINQIHQGLRNWETFETWLSRRNNGNQ